MQSYCHTIMMGQILEHLLAETNAMKERMEVNQKCTDAIPREMKAGIRTAQEKIMTKLETKIRGQ